MNRAEIEKTLKEYSWMINTIRISRESLRDAGEGLTAQYGEEAAMPKAQGTTSDPIYREVLRRSKRWKKIEEYERKITALQSLFHKVHNERESEILYWLLEGKSYRWIAAHMGLSHSHIQKLRISIIDQMANDTNDTDGTSFQENKEAC